jgi:hypothetical protein
VSFTIAATLLAIALNAAADSGGTIVFGGDKKDGWGFSVSVPEGWDFDCCNIAHDANSNLLVFPHGWNGSNRNGVISLRVWPKHSESLDVDWKNDVNDYKKEFPDIASADYAVHVKGSTCRSAVYSGADSLKDYVVICDPGADWHYRFSWSMLVRSDESRGKEAIFRDVVETANLLHVTHDN